MDPVATTSSKGEFLEVSIFKTMSLKMSIFTGTARIVYSRDFQYTCGVFADHANSRENIFRFHGTLETHGKADHHRFDPLRKTSPTWRASNGIGLSSSVNLKNPASRSAFTVADATYLVHSRRDRSRPESVWEFVPYVPVLRDGQRHRLVESAHRRIQGDLDFPQLGPLPDDDSFRLPVRTSLLSSRKNRSGAPWS